MNRDSDMSDDGGSSMDGFVDLDEAIKAEASSRLEKVEKLAGSLLWRYSARSMASWPTLESGMSGPQLLLTSNMH